MSYKLYTDKNENFECEVNVKNASLKNSRARIVVESDDLNLVFPGEIKEGKCVVPIKKLKGLLEENSKGKMQLEIIVEDMYFTPWSSDFIVEEHTSVKVKLNEEKEEETKPTVEVKILKEKSPVDEILYICKKAGVTKENFKDNDGFKYIIKEYFKRKQHLLKESKKYVKEVINALGQ